MLLAAAFVRNRDPGTQHSLKGRLRAPFFVVASTLIRLLSRRRGVPRESPGAFALHVALDHAGRNLALPTDWC